MKHNLDKLKSLSTPLSEKERKEMEYQIANSDWILISLDIAFKVREILENKGISRVELAKRMEVTPPQITKILNGRENLTLKTIAKLEKALGEPLFDIFLQGNMTPRPYFQQGSNSILERNVNAVKKRHRRESKTSSL